MYLKSIRASGFKSFADPTFIPIKSHLTAIVGPNGCGKSNVVDAIKWVIGEISAKQLRGQSMSDIIFNGTTQRQPVGQAMVELHFDNADGRIGGQYAGYAEIIVRREVTRDGQSNYYLNGGLCRRRDILDVFLGTGLGSRSYSIIEQGMISQMIEAKPEVLRQHIEEVAKTSQYRERRKETHTRMRSTQENMERLNDLLDELEKQLRHLKRQSESAEKYNIYKAEEKVLRGQIQALHWQELESKRSTQQQRVEEKNLQIENKRTTQRELETGIEKTRVAVQEAGDQQSVVQKSYYECGAEIARTEQEIKHKEQQQTRWQQELDALRETEQELQEQISEHQQQIEELEIELGELNPQDSDLSERLAKAKLDLQAAESRYETWQRQWDAWQSRASDVKSQTDVARTKIEHYEKQLSNSRQQAQRLQQDLASISLDELTAAIAPLEQKHVELQNQVAMLQQQLDNAREQISTQRQTNNEKQQAIKTAQNALQDLKKRQTTLEALQAAALGNTDKSANDWLAQKQLLQKTRLGQTLHVENGWEAAVETVLGRYFDAVCVDDVANLVGDLTTLAAGRLTLVEKRQAISNASHRYTSLAEKINSDWPLQSWLHDVYVADDAEAAKSMIAQLQAHESVVTRDGVWLGKHFVHVNKKSNPQDSILWRKQQIETLTQQVFDQAQIVESLEQALTQGQAKLVELEAQRDTAQQTYQRAASEASECKSNLSTSQTRLSDKRRQLEQLQKAAAENAEQIGLSEKLLADTREYQQQFLQTQQELDRQREQLVSERETVQSTLANARAAAQQAQQQTDELEIRVSANESQLALLRQTLGRDEKRMGAVEQRRDELSKNLTEQAEPLQELKQLLEQKLQQHVNVRERLQEAETLLAEHAEQLQDLEQERNDVMQKITQLQAELEAVRMEHQTISVRQATIIEQLETQGLTLEQARHDLSEDAVLSVWQENLIQLEKRIERLGPINLAAISEFEQAQERKTYLDKQHADLTEALKILTDAIDKIDRETKTKFKETFDKVNEGLQKTFPRIFGGGRAYLELEGDDLLSAGIFVKAQPPGKKNTSIHMLSGGEKALTAISLVFAMFQLNPAPFCVLDEVDAPLDDLNVGRFCSLVKEMSKETQFIVISHNKVTIEMADHMMGVTMQEPGVSRVVSVDVHEALEMVDA